MVYLLVELVRVVLITDSSISTFLLLSSLHHTNTINLVTTLLLLIGLTKLGHNKKKLIEL